MRWSYAHTQAARFIATCGALGSILGLIVGLTKGERRA